MMSWRTFRFARASHALATRPRVKISMCANYHKIDYKYCIGSQNCLTFRACHSLRTHANQSTTLSGRLADYLFRPAAEKREEMRL